MGRNDGRLDELLLAGVDILLEWQQGVAILHWLATGITILTWYRTNNFAGMAVMIFFLESQQKTYVFSSGSILNARWLRTSAISYHTKRFDIYPQVIYEIYWVGIIILPTPVCLRIPPCSHCSPYQSKNANCITLTLAYFLLRASAVLLEKWE